MILFFSVTVFGNLIVISIRTLKRNFKEAGNTLAHILSSELDHKGVECEELYHIPGLHGNNYLNCVT